MLSKEFENLGGTFYFRKLLRELADRAEAAKGEIAKNASSGLAKNLGAIKEEWLPTDQTMLEIPEVRINRLVETLRLASEIVKLKFPDENDQRRITFLKRLGATGEEEFYKYISVHFNNIGNATSEYSLTQLSTLYSTLQDLCDTVISLENLDLASCTAKLNDFPLTYEQLECIGGTTTRSEVSNEKFLLARQNNQAVKIAHEQYTTLRELQSATLVPQLPRSSQIHTISGIKYLLGLEDKPQDEHFAEIFFYVPVSDLYNILHDFPVILQESIIAELEGNPDKAFREKVMQDFRQLKKDMLLVPSENENGLTNKIGELDELIARASLIDSQKKPMAKVKQINSIIKKVKNLGVDIHLNGPPSSQQLQIILTNERAKLEQQLSNLKNASKIDLYSDDGAKQIVAMIQSGNPYHMLHAIEALWLIGSCKKLSYGLAEEHIPGWSTTQFAYIMEMLDLKGVKLDQIKLSIPLFAHKKIDEIIQADLERSSERTFISEYQRVKAHGRNVSYYTNPANPEEHLKELIKANASREDIFTFIDHCLAKGEIVNFSLKDIHPLGYRPDLLTILDKLSIANMLSNSFQDIAIFFGQNDLFNPAQLIITSDPNFIAGLNDLSRAELIFAGIERSNESFLNFLIENNILTTDNPEKIIIIKKCFDEENATNDICVKFLVSLHDKGIISDHECIDIAKEFGLFFPKAVYDKWLQNSSTFTEDQKYDLLVLAVSNENKTFVDALLSQYNLSLDFSSKRPDGKTYLQHLVEDGLTEYLAKLGLDFTKVKDDDLFDALVRNLFAQTNVPEVFSQLVKVQHTSGKSILEKTIDKLVDKQKFDHLAEMFKNYSGIAELKDGKGHDILYYLLIKHQSLPKEEKKSILNSILAKIIMTTDKTFLEREFRNGQSYLDYILKNFAPSTELAHFAVAKSETIETLQLLLDDAPDLFYMPDSNQKTPVYYANWPAVVELICKKIEIDKYYLDNDKNKPIILKEIDELMLDKWNNRYDFWSGNSLAHYAAGFYQPRLLQHLFEKKYDFLKKNQDNLSVLETLTLDINDPKIIPLAHLAIQGKGTDWQAFLKEIAKNGFDFTTIPGVTKYSTQLFAIFSSNIEMLTMKTLPIIPEPLSKLTDASGNNLAYFAAVSDAMPALLRLHAKGADLTQENIDQISAMDILVQSQHKDTKNFIMHFAKDYFTKRDAPRCYKLLESLILYNRLDIIKELATKVNKKVLLEILKYHKDSYPENFAKGSDLDKFYEELSEEIKISAPPSESTSAPTWRQRVTGGASVTQLPLLLDVLATKMGVTDESKPGFNEAIGKLLGIDVKAVITSSAPEVAIGTIAAILKDHGITNEKFEPDAKTNFTIRAECKPHINGLTNAIAK